MAREPCHGSLGIPQSHPLNRWGELLGLTLIPVSHDGAFQNGSVKMRVEETLQGCETQGSHALAEATVTEQGDAGQTNAGLALCES